MMKMQHIHTVEYYSPVKTDEIAEHTVLPGDSSTGWRGSFTSNSVALKLFENSLFRYQVHFFLNGLLIILAVWGVGIFIYSGY